MQHNAWPATQNVIKYSISILALDNIDLTRRCIDSVMRNSSDYELILTDNGSTDGTKEYFESLYRQNPETVTVISHDQNLGFQRPNIEALAIADGALFVLLNNDSEVPPNWLELLEAPFKDNPKVALSGPVGTCCALHSDFRGYPSRNFEYLEGSCLMCKTEIVRKHGLFSPNLYFAYCEDADLSLRMRELGYSIHQVPFTLKHQQGATSRKIPGIDEIQESNRAVMQQRWGHYARVRRFDYPIVLKRTAAIGDVLLLTPIIRALKEQRPLSPIGVHTQWPELFFGNPNVSKADKNLQVPKDSLVISLDMAYENMERTHIVDAFGITCGLDKWERKTELFGVSTLPEFSEERWCAMHVGPTTWAGKTWPIDRFQQVSDWMRSEGWKIVLVGNPSAWHFNCDVDLRGRTTIGYLAAVLKSVKLFVGVDSMPIHAAQAVGTPVVGIFGATLPEFILTEGSPHIGVAADPKIPCAGERHRIKGATYTPCAGLCVASVTVEQVIEAIREILPTI